jgi:flagellar M-ring protein FliF
MDNTQFGVDKTVTHRTVAPGGVNRLSVALLVDSSVPAAQLAGIKQSVSNLAGLQPSRGDSIAVTTLSFAKPKATSTPKASPIAGIMKNPLALGKWVVVGLGAAVFLFLMRGGLKRREDEGVAPEPTWLREVESAMPLHELEAGTAIGRVGSGIARPALDAAAQQRNQVREEVEEIAIKQPQQIAAQVGQWLKE